MNNLIGFGVIGAALVLAGCSGNSTSGGGLLNQPAPRVRAVNALDGVGTADWQVTGQNNISFPAIPYSAQSNDYSDPYVILNERGQQTVNFYNSAAPTVVVASASHSFIYTDKVTVVAYGSGPGNTITLQDQTTNSSSGGPNVRIVDAAQQIGSLDVFITPTGTAVSGSPSTIAPGAVYPTQTSSGGYNYFTLPLPGSYTVTCYHQGQDTGAPVLTYSLTVGNSDVWTLVLIDNQTNGATGTPTVLAIQDNNSNAG